MNLREIIRFAKAISQGGPSLEDVLKKEKKPCIYVGMVCVREAYQGQGYMRKVMLLCMERTALPVWMLGGGALCAVFAVLLFREYHPVE